jgi:hypothetical protein
MAERILRRRSQTYSAAEVRFSYPGKWFWSKRVCVRHRRCELQGKRHAADYDPMIRMKTSDALFAIKTARAAVRRFSKASAARRHAFLSLLVFPPRRL